MRLHSPSMSELHAFVTAARLGSFTQAAEALCVTQGAVSRAISRLEAHFGQPLMRRNAHGLTLTDTGRKLYDGAQEPLRAIETLSAGLRAQDRRLQLTLSSVPTLASAWLMPRLSDFHQRHPEIQLSFAPYRRDEDFSGTTPDASILGRAGPMARLAGRLRDRPRNGGHLPSRAPGRAAVTRHGTRPPACWASRCSITAMAWRTGRNGSAPSAPRERLKLASGFDQVSLLVRAVMADMGIAVLQRCLVRDDLLAGRVAAPFPGASPAAAISARRHSGATAPARKWLLDTAARIRTWRRQEARPPCSSPPPCRAAARRDKAPRKGWFLRCRRGKSGRELEAQVHSPFVRFAQPFGAAAQAAEMILAAFLAATLRRVGESLAELRVRRDAGQARLMRWQAKHITLIDASPQT